jgi:hypothetical protein
MCVRNTEEAEKASLAHAAAAAGSSSATPALATPNSENQAPSSGRGHAKGVWGMLEESKLAQAIRRDEEKLVRFPSQPRFLSPNLIVMCRSTRTSFSRPEPASTI